MCAGDFAFEIEITFLNDVQTDKQKEIFTNFPFLWKNKKNVFPHKLYVHFASELKIPLLNNYLNY